MLRSDYNKSQHNNSYKLNTRIVLMEIERKFEVDKKLEKKYYISRDKHLTGILNEVAPACKGNARLVVKDIEGEGNPNLRITYNMFAGDKYVSSYVQDVILAEDCRKVVSINGLNKKI